MRDPSLDDAAEAVAAKYALSSGYLSSGRRIFSYAHQLATVFRFRPRKVLEVGKGPGLVAAALKSQGIQVVTLDLQPGLKPDLVGSVTDIPAGPGEFDVSMCCQVLEHLPFDQFGVACRELRRVTRQGLVLSLPDITKHYAVRLRLPWIKDFSWTCSVPRWRGPRQKTAANVKGHFWEIGFRGASLRAVRDELRRSGWREEKSWRVPELVWHRFFALNVSPTLGRD